MQTTTNHWMRARIVDEEPEPRSQLAGITLKRHIIEYLQSSTLVNLGLKFTSRNAVSALSDTPTGSIPIACKGQLAYRFVSRRSGGTDEGADMHDFFQAPARMRPIAALIAVLAAATVAACDRPASSQTAGQKLDSTMANAEQKANEAKDSAKAAAGEVAQSTERMAGEVSDKVKDAAITTAVNAKIAGDPRLSIMRINVDTVDGRVLLRGTAPDATSSQRAQQLAASVEGVVGVDNQLVVSGKS